MPALLPLRAELASGDLRGLYLAWHAAEAGAFDDEDVEDVVEPPVPPGLGQLSASLDALARFLRISDDLIAAAARSPALPAAPAPEDLQRWIVSLPAAEKDALLLQFAGNAMQAQAKLMQRFQQASILPTETRSGGRTVTQLLAEAEKRAAAIQRQEAARREAERIRREREAASARATYLDGLVGREEELWRQADALIQAKRPKEYDQAVQLLTDLRDLSVRQDSDEAFATRLSALREEYAKRHGLIERLDRAELPE